MQMRVDRRDEPQIQFFGSCTWQSTSARTGSISTAAGRGRRRADV
jgi:hypothetical protein